MSALIQRIGLLQQSLAPPAPELILDFASGSDATDSVSPSVTIGTSDSSSYHIVCIAGQFGGSITGVTIGGSALTLINNYKPASFDVIWWGYRAFVGSGAQTVAVTTGSGTNFRASAFVWTVSDTLDPTSPVDQDNWDTEVGRTVTTAAGGILLGATLGQGGNTTLSGTNVIEDEYFDAVESDFDAAAYRINSSDTVTGDITITSDTTGGQQRDTYSILSLGLA